MKKIALLPVIMFLLFTFLPLPTRADGFAIYTDRTYFALHDKTTQVAAINYENGREKLLLAVKLDKLMDNSVVWIVPVPADASKVKINIFQEFPEFSGEDILLVAEESKEVVRHTALIIASTQIWTYPFLAAIMMPQIGHFLPPGVEVHAHVEKEGIVTEVITAETATGLYQYLEGKNVTIPPGSIPVLNEYIGQNYAFVTSWVKSIHAKDKAITPAIFVEFPTDKLYYPLKPTSVYGEKQIPVLLYVIGCVSPNLYPDIENFTEYRYFLGSISGPPEFYHRNEESPGIYTRIMIGSSTGLVPTPPAGYLVNDLWMEKLDEPPVEIKKALATIEKARFFEEKLPAALIPWLICLSLASGSLAGFIVFRKPKKFALIGLSNCLTLIGLIIATLTLAKDEKGIREKGNRGLFIGLFSVLFLAINFLVVYPVVICFLLV